MSVGSGFDAGAWYEGTSAAVVLIDRAEGIGYARRVVEEKAEEVGVETRLLYGES